MKAARRDDARYIADMRAYDTLGPLARAAVMASPAELWVGPMLAGWRQDNPEIMGRDEGYSLTDPKIDASVAAFVNDAVRRKFGKPVDAFVVRARA